MGISRRDFFRKGTGLLGSYALIASVPLEAKNLSGANEAPLKSKDKTEKRIAGSFDKAMRQENLNCDVLVAGGGLAGVCAAISAAREGAKVILLQDRSRLGGNSSSEIRMHPLGMHYSQSGFREGGIIEEIFLENLIRNPQKEWEPWDLLLYDKVFSEPNIKLFLDTDLCGAKTSEDKITKAYARCDSSHTFYEIDAKIFIDCTGDSRLAEEAGATLMSGRDTPQTYDEKLSGYDPQGTHQGSSIMFTAKDYGKPMPFIAPSWARKITPNMLKYRNINKEHFEYGYWWIELGGDKNAILDHEQLRHELLRVVLGIWDYIKNSGDFPESANWAFDGIGMLPGRRDTFRIAGEYTMTQHDIEGGWKNFKDAIATGGWSMDDHPKEGFDATNRPPCRQIGDVKYYNISLGTLISKDFKNLMMAGRNISCSHVAFTSTRVMATCAALGQAAGTAAAMCVQKNTLPNSIRSGAKLIKELQQILLLNNQAIVNVKNEDAADLALLAKAASSANAKDTLPENVINGIAIELKGERKNRWIAQVKDKPWLELKWEKPQKLSRLQITFDSGTRELTMSKNKDYVDRIHWGAQPEIVKDFKLVAILPNGEKEILADVKNNWKKVCRLNFASKEYSAIKIEIDSTNGNEFARIVEVRAYA